MQVKETCLHCGDEYPVEELRKHVQCCRFRWAGSDFDSDFKEELKPKTLRIVISSQEQTPEVENCTLFPYHVVMIIIDLNSVKMQHKLRERSSTMSFQGVLLDRSRFNPDS